MTEQRPTVALLEAFDDHLISAFRDALPDGSLLIGEANADDGLGQADYLVTWKADLDQARLAAAPRLRGVVKLDSGTGVVLEEECKSRGVKVVRATSPGLISVAEHTVMLILAVFKRLGVAIARTQAGELAAGVAPKLTDQEDYSYNWVGLEKFEAVHGKTIGLVGLGRIGMEVATRMKAFQTEVVYTKRHPPSAEEERDLGVRFLPFDELLAASHCVSLHNRFDETNEKMMGAREFALMPDGSFFVNTARGRLVDEDALCAALTSNHLAGAALDVFWYEPPLPGSPLWRAPNLIMTPHTGGIPLSVTLAEEFAQAASFISDDWQQTSMT